MNSMQLKDDLSIVCNIHTASHTISGAPYKNTGKPQLTLSFGTKQNTEKSNSLKIMLSIK